MYVSIHNGQTTHLHISTAFDDDLYELYGTW